jgi:hypothetical protein
MEQKTQKILVRPEGTVLRQSRLGSSRLFGFDDVISVVSERAMNASILRWSLRTQDHELIIKGEDHMISLLENAFARWVVLQDFFLHQVKANSHFSKEAQKILSEEPAPQLNLD